MIPRSRPTRTAIGLLLTAALSSACQPPDRGAGLYVEHPAAWGRDMIAIYDGTFSDTARDIRIRTHTLPPEVLAANLEYPTSGAKNREIEALIDEHGALLLTYLESHPESRVTLTGFSQGGCLALDLLYRLQQSERARAQLGRISLLLVAPARGVQMGRSTEVARRMIERCARAEDAIVAELERAPDSALATLIGERTWIAWSCDDGIVGHDTFRRGGLQDRVADERVLYRRRLSHLQWTGEDVAPGDDEVYLASAIALAITQGVDPRVAVAPYGGFDGPCRACERPAGPMDSRCPG